MEYYSILHIKKNEMLFAENWIKLEIMLSEISQTKKDKMNDRSVQSGDCLWVRINKRVMMKGEGNGG
jgi:hypothetical protein